VNRRRGPHGGARERDVGQDIWPPAARERARRESGGRGPGEAERTGDRARGGAGFERTVVVLAKRLDCRSRRTTSGPHLTLRRRAVGTEGGSSPAARERFVRRKGAGSRVSAAKPRDRWRAPRSYIPAGSGTPPGNRGDLRGAFVGGRRSGSKKRRALTGTTWERSSAQRETRPARSRCAREARQGASEGSSSTSHVVDNAAVR